MARRYIRIGGLNDVVIYDDAVYSSAVESDGPIVGSSVSWSGTPNRITDTDGSGVMDVVDDLTDYFVGQSNEIEVVDDGDGTVTIRGAGENTTTSFAVVTGIQAGGAGAIGFQYRTRTITLSRGIITTVSAESSWNDI